MFIHVPGGTTGGIKVTTGTEYLDLMPTLAELAAGASVPPCPEGDSFKVAHW